jgi:hypothetical protein
VDRIAKGGSFNITQKLTKQAIQVVPKFYYANITLYKEDIQVFNNGSDEAIFSIVKAATEEAYTWIGAQLSIGLYLDGQQPVIPITSMVSLRLLMMVLRLL